MQRNGWHRKRKILRLRARDLAHRSEKTSGRVAQDDKLRVLTGTRTARLKAESLHSKSKLTRMDDHSGEGESRLRLDPNGRDVRPHVVLLTRAQPIWKVLIAPLRWRPQNFHAYNPTYQVKI